MTAFKNVIKIVLIILLLSLVVFAGVKIADAVKGDDPIDSSVIDSSGDSSDSSSDDTIYVEYIELDEDNIVF